MIIGIDLGTTNSLVSIWRDGASHVIPNKLGLALTPSVVGLDDQGQIVIGQAAKERLLTHPLLTASVFKRYMGSNKSINLGSEHFTPQELSAFVVKSLKADAEEFLGHEVTEAVITVPAYFNDTQRKFTKMVGELAGLKVERILNEPTGAALAYGLHEKEDIQFLVFDLGGGTFDVSVLELFDDIMEVRASAGDNQLGGEEFSSVIIDLFIKNLTVSETEKLSLREKYLHRLNAEAERAKLALSRDLEYVMNIDLDDFQHTLVLSRDDFEKACQPLLKRLQLPVKQALRDSNIKPAELDAVILVGGATRMPMISKLVTTMFGRFPEKKLDPDQVVAMGAAVQAALKSRDQALNEMVLTDICPYTLGIAVASETMNGQYRSGVFSPIIERNTTVPVSKQDRFYSIYENQDVINVRVYQGESREVSDNIFLGLIEVKVKPAPAGDAAVDVRFSYDINGLLEVETSVVGTDDTETLIIADKSHHLSKDDIKASLEKLNQLKIHPRENTENITLIHRGKRLYESNLSDRREIIGQLLDNFMVVLDTQDEHEIRKARKDFSEQLNQFEY